MRKIAVVGAVLLGTAGTVALSAPSASAASKCWVGSWKVTSASADIKSPDLNFKFKGGKDIKVKIDKKGKAFYDFNGSKPLKGSGTVKGLPTSAELSLTKKLTIANKVTGSAKGKITSSVKTVKGDAKLTVKPLVGPAQSASVVAAVKKGNDYGVLPRKATFTCKGKTLTVKQKVKQKDLTSTTAWTFKRS
ncbi:hypothetical protein GCM10027589_10400 [Actinocorallia lasiicapitis]